MKKIFFATIFTSSLLLFANFAHASIVISEIMYDVSSDIGADSDREWVEVYNNGTEEIDLTGWKFYDGSNHNLNIPPAGGGRDSIIIPANSYAVLSGNAETFISMYPSFSGTVIDTVMSLNNESDTLKILNAEGAVSSEASYSSTMGANGDGNSLQLINGEFKAGIPTIGSSANEENNTSNTSSGGSVGGGSASSSGASKPTVIKKEDPAKITTEIISKTVLPTNIDSKFEAKTLGLSRENLQNGKWVWNMGDGMSFEKNNPEPIFYSYQYAGEYLITLEYYNNFYNPEPTAVDEILIKTFALELPISILGTDGNKYIAIQNKTSNEVNLSKFYLQSETGKNFIFPQGTKIFPSKTLIIPPKVAGFEISDSSKIEILYPSGQPITSALSVPAMTSKSSRVSREAQRESNFQFLPTSIDEVNSDTQNTSLENKVIKDSLKANALVPILNNRFIIILGFIGLLVLGSVAVFRMKVFSKNEKESVKENISAEDFELIDE